MRLPIRLGASPAGEVSHTSPDDEAIAAQAAWSALAALVAGSAYMRFATRAGKYPRPANAPKITGTLPRRPAAVLLHGTDGCVSTLCLDLDTSKAAQSVVDADANAIGELLTASGLRYVADHSPSGGRHIYVPLASRLDHAAARELVEALASRFASLDPGPHQNLSDGCIRPPGSPHKSGSGYQVLDTPLSLAYDIMRVRNSDTAIASLRSALAASIHQIRNRKAPAGVQTPLHAVGAASAAPISFAKAVRSSALKGSPMRQLAATGIYDTARYRTPSDARMAVLTHLANFPITLDEIRQRFATNFAGLAALYTSQRHMDRLLTFEWDKALAHVGKNPRGKRAGAGSSLKSDTEPALTHGGADQSQRSSVSVMHEINDLENVLYAVLDQRLAKSGREGILLRMLIRAVLGFARKKESLVIDVGCRAFALDMGRHHGTIAKLLPRLEKLTDGFIERIERGRGKGADVYLLSLPAQWRDTADALSWRKGKIYGVRPVFRVLGDVAALVYESIERARLAPTAAEIVRATGIGRTAVDKALKTLAELSMIERSSGTWDIVHTTNLSQIADWIGAQDEYEYQLRLVRAQRLDWHAHLERHQAPAIYEEDLYDREKDEWDPWDPNFSKASDPPDRSGAPAA